MNDNRRAGGFKAKRVGQSFERSFELRCGFDGIDCVRIPDGCRQLSATKLVRCKSPFDYVLRYKDKTACLDLKTTEKSAFTYSMIDPAQVHALAKLQTPNNVTGYFVYFRKENVYSLISAESLFGARFRSSVPGRILRCDGISLPDLRQIFS